MHVRLAAVAVWVAAAAAAWTAAAAAPMAMANPLTLDDAFARVARNHPELRLLGARGEVLAAERDSAALRPALVGGMELENAFGTGAYGAVEDAELTLTLASVLEQGGKLDARRTLAQSRVDALAIEREARRLDLLAEVARRYLAVNAAVWQRDMAALEIDQRRRAVAAARQRLEAGASPEAVLLTAEAALARAELGEARAAEQEVTARQHLAALWGEKAPQFEIARIDPRMLPAIAGADALAALLERTPELARFADARRIREARLQLARASASGDLHWQVGVRRLQDADDTALVGSVSLPLGSRRRAQPDIRAAQAELAALAIEREAGGLALYSTLIEAHGRYEVAQLEVQRLRDDVLPRLARAETAAEGAYRAGAVSYLEWAQLQSEQTDVRRRQLDAAIDGQRVLIEIQRLTGQPFVAGPATERGTQP